MRKIFVLFFIFILLANFANAERFVNYNLKEGKIDSNGNFQTTDNNIDNVNVAGYVCLDEGCKTLGKSIFTTKVMTNGFPTGLGNGVLNSGSNSFIQLNYPTVLQSNYGYALYYYKDGYIPWESNPNWFGTDPSDPKGPYNVYLSKKEACSSKVEELTIKNSERPNTPVVFSVKANVDTKTKSAINEGSGPLKAVPQELKPQYSVRTLVSIAVYDENNLPIFNDKKEVSIGFSQLGDTEFSFTPQSAGDYRAVVTTNVVDDKCSSSVPESKEKEFFVLEEYPQNTCYTKLGNLVLSNNQIVKGQDLPLSFNKLSNLQLNKEKDDIKAVPTTVNLQLINLNQEVVFEKTFELKANSNTFESEKTNLIFTIPNTIEKGFYNLVLSGTANDNKCLNDNQIDFLEDQLLILDGSGFNAPHITSTPILSAKLGETYTYDVDATDPDGDSISYSIFGPSGMNIDKITGLITWDVNNRDFSKGQKKNVLVIASDGLFFDVQIFTITIGSNDNLNRKHKVNFGGFELETSNVQEGINGLIQLKNTGDFKENDVSITADIYDLGVHEILTENLNLGKQDTLWIPLSINLPKNTKAGEYLVNIRISNTKHSEERNLVVLVEK